jgi:hypothetical protein
MTQAERRLWLIRALCAERSDLAGAQIPVDEDEQRAFLRALMNVRPPEPIGDEFLGMQDVYLQERLAEQLETVPEEAMPLVMAMISNNLSTLLSGIEIGKQMENRPA